MHMHMHMPKFGSCGEPWGAPYVRTSHGDGTQLVTWHIWPMVGVAWLLFMCGAMMGAKSAMMKHRMMMGGMCGPMGAGMYGKRMGMHGHGMPMGMGGMGMPGKMGMYGKGMGMMMGGMPHHHHGFGMQACCCGEEKAEEGTPETPSAT